MGEAEKQCRRPAAKAARLIGLPVVDGSNGTHRFGGSMSQAASHAQLRDGEPRARRMAFIEISSEAATASRFDGATEAVIALFCSKAQARRAAARVSRRSFACQACKGHRPVQHAAAGQAGARGITPPSNFDWASLIVCSGRGMHWSYA